MTSYTNVTEEIKRGFNTAFIDGESSANVLYTPQFVSNNSREGQKVISSIEDELLRCQRFQISVAFITMGGITPLLQTLKELEIKGVPGEILTTNYLSFSEPAALKKLHELKNITLKMYDVIASDTGFHTKGYIFKDNEIYRIIIGSSNITSAALTINKEWNTKIISTEQGEIAEKIIAEYKELWNSKYSLDYDNFIETYDQQYEIAKHQRASAKEDEIVSLEKYKLQPNSMQVGFIANLKKILALGENRALLISATGTGKTYASAFAMRELGFKRVLFLVHRNQLAKQAKRSYERVFGKNIRTGIVGAGHFDYDADYIFATRDTLWREEHLHRFSPADFDCIILDEAHHSAADTYQRIMNYFSPKLWLGMTATPDKRDDNIEGKNIYEIFHYQIAYEIRLQQAMEENMLCPFHYFGISDLSVIGDIHDKGKERKLENFNLLVSDERVRHIAEQAQYFGYSGDKVKGLIFCSRIPESQELSRKFNQLINPNTGKYYRTIALNGDSSEQERTEAFERLAMNESDSVNGKEPLDYIFSVEILNEGVDIVEVNQVIMLRPTQSPIVFIQQLGRGLRKAEGKEYVVILDFIGNYDKNFMIPVALSGDRTYNADTIRKYVISGNSTIPGTSTVHFDAISKEKIFHSIDRIRGLKDIIRDSYISLKSRLGRIPYLMDFYSNGEIDPLVIIREYKSYYTFLQKMEKENYQSRLSDKEELSIEYLSKTIISGVRPYELEILNKLLSCDTICIPEFGKYLKNKYLILVDNKAIEDAVSVLEGHFVSKDEEYQKYKVINILKHEDGKLIHREANFTVELNNEEFRKQVADLVNVGLSRYKDVYANNQSGDVPFVLYQKYTRRDVCLLMNCGRDLSSTMYGMKRIGDDVFIFVTYHKQGAENDDMQYAAGKPDYADTFVDGSIFRWDSQIGKGPESGYMQDVITAKRKHLLVKKSDAESSFYYMGTFDIDSVSENKKQNNNGKWQAIAKVSFRMHKAVREDLLKYLQSNLLEEENKAV